MSADIEEIIDTEYHKTGKKQAIQLLNIATDIARKRGLIVSITIEDPGDN